MTEKEKHLQYVKNSDFSCEFMKPILSPNEYEDLCKYGSWLMALYKKEIEAITPSQTKFCNSIDSETPPNDYFSNLFWRYLKRKELVNTQNLNNRKKIVKDDRADWKKIRNSRY